MGALTDCKLAELCLNPEDLARVAEFFDCDVDAAYAFVRKVWLPDADEAVRRITAAVRRRDWTSLLFLCDHLREGARSVGATRIIQFAGEIERAVQHRHICSLPKKIAELGAALNTMGSLLADCSDDAYAVCS